jgi:ubiquinone/menaquinone biosynthesis C-methylase UbiE
MRYKALAEYYDSEYADLEMLRHDVPFFLGQLPKRRQSVLELCVGTGRAAIPIVQAGHKVVGVDYAPDLLKIAKRKRDVVGLKDSLELRRGDVRKLRISQSFDWICIFFNTLLGFATLDELDQVLSGVRRHLKPRGRFWLDIFQPDLHLLLGEKRTGLDARAFFVPQLNRTVFETTDIRRDLAKQVQDVTFNYNWFDDFGRKHGERITFQMTWLFPRELELLLERNGLRIEEMWGNYDGSPLRSDSPRIIARCVRA